VVLEGAEVGVKMNVWFHKAKEHSPGFNDALGINKDCPNNGLENVAEYLKIVFVQLIQVQGFVAVFSSSAIIRGQQLLNNVDVLVELIFKPLRLVVIKHMLMNSVLYHY